MTTTAPSNTAAGGGLTAAENPRSAGGEGIEEEIEEPASGWASLSDDILCSSLAPYFDAQDLLSIPCLSRRLRASDANLDPLWRKHCQRRWQHWPRYRLTDERDNELAERFPMYTWKQKYLWAEKDAMRTTLTKNELESLGWYFNFAPSAGGREDETLTRAVFRSGSLHLIGMPQYPPMPYRLVNVNSSQQQLLIVPFPSHNITRNEDDREFLIANENVTFVSCGPGGELRYRGRGFRRNITYIQIREAPYSITATPT
jgi:hypothetical protein